MANHKKLNWVTLTGIATVGATIVSVLVFLFGEGVLQYNFIAPATLIPTNSSSSQTQVVTAAVVSTDSSSSFIKVQVSQTISTTNDIATLTLNYVEFESDTILLHITIDNSKDPFNLLTCGLPRVTKSHYGEVAPLKERGGFYSRVSESCFLGMFSEILIDMETKQDGWLVFDIDDSRFRKEGLYSLTNLGEFFPTMTFEIKDNP